MKRHVIDSYPLARLLMQLNSPMHAGVVFSDTWFYTGLAEDMNVGLLSG